VSQVAQYAAAGNPDKTKIEPTTIKGCHFCEIRKETRKKKPEFDAMNVPLWSQYLNSLGHILPKRITGNCSKHQRQVARVVRKARDMGLFTYKKSVFEIVNPFPDTILKASDIIEYNRALKSDDYTEMAEDTVMGNFFESERRSIPEPDLATASQLESEDLEYFDFDKAEYEEEIVPPLDDNIDPEEYDLDDETKKKYAEEKIADALAKRK